MSSEKDNAPASTGGRVTSFLTSGTGILTAIATLAAAIAGLVTALSQLGEDSPEPATQQSPTVTTVLVESDAQRELRSRIPDSIWPTCGPPVNPEEGAVAAFNCKHRTIVGLQYNLFSSSQELGEAYQQVKRRYGLAGSTPGDSCAAGMFEGVYRAAGRDAGRLLCFVDEPGHVAAIVWTHDGLDILSFAWRDDMKLPALFDAWQTGVGPAE